MISFLFSVVFSLTAAHANSNACTWEAQDGISCVYNTQDARVWVNSCSDNRSYRVCSPTSPDTFNGDCSAWTASPNVRCATYPGSSVYEKQWLRICLQPGYVTEFCSDRLNPNNLDVPPQAN